MNGFISNATRLVRAGELREAVRVIQQGLRRKDGDATNGASSAASRPAIVVERVASPPRAERAPPRAERAPPAPPSTSPIADAVHRARPRGSIRDAIAEVVARRRDVNHAHEGIVPAADAPPGTFTKHIYADANGERIYKLYVPTSYRSTPIPLVVMLHGCTQSADDFAAGTGMNRLAEQQGFLVAYPEQPASANPQRCWNWFRPEDQQADSGEPALIAGITRTIMRDFAVNPAHVFIAGLSAGGAAAAIVGQAYPKLFSAIGVHSGLAPGAARDLPSALTAMRNGSVGARSHVLNGAMPRMIVFHGDADKTVHARNGENIIAHAAGHAASTLRSATTTTDRTPNGRAYQRTTHRNGDGRAVLEHWVVRGAGHAWSGGSPTGSYTDASGPNASAEMLRFFLDDSQRR